VPSFQNIAFEPNPMPPGVKNVELAWYAIQTFPRHEKRVTTELQEKGIRALLPLVSDKRQWSDRRVVVDTPLFPGYVFVRIAQEQSERVIVLRTASVRNFVGMRGMGDPIPDSQIDSVRAIVAKNVSFQACPFVDIGRRVRIRGGSLEGIEGILTAINGDESLVISVDLIQRSLAIRVSGFKVEPV
jgi:transcription antitermination factor NusG